MTKEHKLLGLLISMVIIMLIISNFKGVEQTDEEIGDKIPERVYIEENTELIPYLVITDNYGGNYLLMREYLLDEPMRYHTNVLYSSYYADSEIGKYLNEVFYETLSENVRGSIVESTIEITRRESLGSGGKETETIKRKVFLPSYTEMTGGTSRTNLQEGLPLTYFTEKNSRVAYYRRGNPGSWWLRTANTADVDVVNGISTDGAIGAGGIIGLSGEYLNGVRPTFCIGRDTKFEQKTDSYTGKEMYILR